MSTRVFLPSKATMLTKSISNLSTSSLQVFSTIYINGIITK